MFITDVLELRFHYNGKPVKFMLRAKPPL